MSENATAAIPLKLQSETCASTGKFRVMLLIDSELYQLGEDQSSVEGGEVLVKASGKEAPFQIFNDRGEAQCHL